MTQTVNKTSKSILSRLLATENICVIHDKKARTASFDIKNRVLRLPVFQDMTEELYDMLVAHEVAHALYTPFTDEDMESLKVNGYLSSAIKICGNKEEAAIAHGYMNVVEDARIERLIKDKFPGLRRDFYVAYKNLNDMDFFELAGESIADKSFIDRINLYFKIGVHVSVGFTEEELHYVTMVEQTRSFDDVIEVAKKIWEYCKEKKQASQQDISSNNTGESYADSQSISQDVLNSPEMSDGETNNQASNSASGNWHTKAITPEMCSTQEKLDKNLGSLVSNKLWDGIVYHSLPTVNKKHTIVTFEELLGMFERHNTSNNDMYQKITQETKKFVEDSNRVVNILAQDFMAKKAAKNHTRNKISRTGIIDTVRLVNYKFTDDIFGRVNITYKGKSHGLVFYVDLSGSMSAVLDDTFRQLIQLVLFCKRVNIPFEVYGFTTRRRDGQEVDSYSSSTYTSDIHKTWNYKPSPYDSANNNSFLNPFSLINIFSHKMTKNQLDISMRNIMLVGAYYRTHGGRISIPSIMHLSSTPLVEAIVSAMDIVPEFKSENNLDIVNTVFMTDGEATGVNITCTNTNVHKNNILYKMNPHFTCESNMIDIFKTVTGTKAICFYLNESRSTVGLYAFAGKYEPDLVRNKLEEANRQYYKEGWTTAMNSSHAYDEKFILRANNAVENSDLDEILMGKTSTVGIRNGFIKAMNKNIVSRTMLNRFIDVIAKE